MGCLKRNAATPKSMSWKGGNVSMKRKSLRSKDAMP